MSIFTMSPCCRGLLFINYMECRLVVKFWRQIQLCVKKNKIIAYNETSFPAEGALVPCPTPSASLMVTITSCSQMLPSVLMIACFMGDSVNRALMFVTYGLKLEQWLFQRANGFILLLFWSCVLILHCTQALNHIKCAPDSRCRQTAASPKC